MNSIWENEEIVDDILRRFFDEFFEEKILKETLLSALQREGRFKDKVKLHIKQGVKMRLADLYRMAVMLDLKLGVLNNMISLKSKVLHSHKPKCRASFIHNNNVYYTLEEIFETHGEKGYLERLDRLYSKKQGEGGKEKSDLPDAKA